ncbi:hypothetical protein PENSPDRAFT_733272 [Peniophora sp. CONT]|nr:hypothetical protein PENSPDRAFT_733272 [Peniophora sp. CONT]
MRMPHAIFSHTSCRLRLLPLYLLHPPATELGIVLLSLHSSLPRFKPSPAIWMYQEGNTHGVDVADEDIFDSDEESEPSLRFTSQYNLGGLPLTLTTTHTQHDELPHTYVVTHNVHTLNESGDKIRVAQAESVLIDREEVLDEGEDEWFFHMDAESHDALNLYEQVLSGDGGVKETIVSGNKRGSGIWGHELDDGAFLLIKELYVQQPYRNRGVAKWLLRQIVSTPSFVLPSGPGIVTCPWAFAWPFPVESRNDEGEAIVKRTFNTAGFSQVGTTTFWAYSIANDQHPSRIATNTTAPSQGL